MTIFIQTDFASAVTANTQVKIDVRGERFGDLQDTFALPSGFAADRWYIGWWGEDGGPTLFEWRLDDAGPPAWASSEILTAVRTRAGPEFLPGNLPNPHFGQACIWRWFWQEGRDIFYRGTFEIFLYKARDPNNHPEPVDLYSRPETIGGPSGDGPALTIPRDITRMLWLRIEAARKPGSTPKVWGENSTPEFPDLVPTTGLAQANFAPYPLPSWDPSTHPNFAITVKGPASEEPPGNVVSAWRKRCPYNPGTGKLVASIASDSLGTLTIEGFRILPYIAFMPPVAPTVTASPGLFRSVETGGGALSNLVDGALGDNVNDAAFFTVSNMAVVNHWIRYTYATPQAFNTFRWRQHNTVTMGNWKIRVTNDGTNWTELVSSFGLGGMQDQVTALNNSAPWLIYELVGLSGTAGNPWVREAKPE